MLLTFIQKKTIHFNQHSACQTKEFDAILLFFLFLQCGPKLEDTKKFLQRNMKMTLSSPNTSNDRHSGTTSDNKSLSPNSSPRGSPRPSPKPQTKHEHSKSDTLLTVNFKELTVPTNSANKSDGSPTTPDVNITNRMGIIDFPTQTPEYNRSESTGGSSGKERKDGRVKKKSSWFNSLYPTYKSRSEDYKRIFKDVPDEERLVVDYSCALQKEILVQGRLYVSQNYLCFYANIFGWETNVTLKWKDVAAITKEKTALVIPNAILICTRQEKFFFTSFVARDKTYLMLFRVWQNALMDQPMSTQEMWQWVHQCYGDELGLTSDDEDYVAPGTEDDKLSARLSVESFSEQECGSNTDGVMDQMTIEDKNDEENTSLPPLNPNNIHSHDIHLQTDHSDTTDSDGEKKFDSAVQCTASHDGRQLMNEVMPIHIDQLFTLLFTSSKFYLDFHALRKTTDLTQTPWTHNPIDNSKSRSVHLTVALTQAVGPKSAQVTETQVMLPCSKAGFLYSIDIETVNAGIPYADSFCILVHYCLQKVSDTQSSLAVYAQIKYKKSVWGLVKGMIEKSCWQGLEEFFTALTKALQTEGEETVYPAVKRKSRRRRRVHSLQRSGTEDVRSKLGTATRVKASAGSIFNSDLATLIVFAVLIVLVILNVMLYYKLWSLEETPPYTLLDLHILKDPPKSHDEWIKLLQQQETLHTVEMQKWQRILKTAIQLLRQTEESLNELQRSIHPTYTNKVMSILQNHKDTIKKTEEL